MDEQASIADGLIAKLFDLGVMGIEIPEVLGGAGASFFHAVLAVEALSRVDPSIGVLVDVQNTLVINALLRWGSEAIKQRYLPRLAAGHDRRLRAFGSRVRQRRIRPQHARPRIGRRLGRMDPEWPQAVDHQREGSRPVHRVRDRRPRGRVSRRHRVRRRAGVRGADDRPQGRQARHPGEQHLRTDPRGLPRAWRRVSSGTSARATRSRSKR